MTVVRGIKVNQAPWKCEKPGHPADAKMVESCSGRRSHVVLYGKGGPFKCDEECLNFLSPSVIFSHTVAVVHINDGVQEFTSWFKTAPFHQNLLFIKQL